MGHEHEQQDAVKPNGDAATLDNSDLFNPANWKNSGDNRLSPDSPIQPASWSKVECRKPPKDHYVRVHPDPALSTILPLYVDSESKKFEAHLIAPKLALQLPAQVQSNVVDTRLSVAITDTKKLFLWPVPQTGSEWHESAEGLVQRAMGVWLKVLPEAAGYRCDFPLGELDEPVFPDWSLSKYLELAFKSRFISSVDHPIFRRLAGLR